MNRMHIMSGANGQLLTDIVNLYREDSKYNYMPLDRKSLNANDFSSLENIFERYSPEVFIQGASVHNVEDLENDSKTALITNIASLHKLSTLCNKHDCLLINFSTNYVFRGESHGPIEDYEKPDAVNLYGISKQAGEQVLENYCNKYLNFRVSGLFGKTGSRAKSGNNFIFTVLNKLKEDGNIEVVDDQYCNVTYTKDAAELIYEIIDKLSQSSELYYNAIKMRGHSNFHLINEESCTWFDVAKFVAILKGYSEDQVIPVKTSRFYSAINRPMHTSIKSSDFKKDFGVEYEMSNWQSAVIRFLRDIGELR